jgi:nicotinamide mononucleotide (NMN) deamidase PncC
LEHCKKDEKSIVRYKRAVKRKLDVDEEIIDDSDHDSENVANILLDLSTLGSSFVCVSEK